jgi:putative ABC transport system substrate-binding protein
MRRRDFFSFLATVSVTWPIAARAQPAKQPVVGVLGSASPAAYTERLTAIRQGLAETGFAEGRTVAIDYRWAEGSWIDCRA